MRLFTDCAEDRFRTQSRLHDMLSTVSEPPWATASVRLSFVVAACLLVEAVVAKEILDVSLGYVSQLAALWVFIAYLVTGRHDKSAATAPRSRRSPSPSRCSASTPSDKLAMRLRADPRARVD
jgi:hypothetical protein